jgi:solute carrier family 8 (sodium/calcium exchanger)
MSYEHDWPNGVRIAVYGAGLLWLFAGVAIISDIFMGAIETITSKKKQVVNPATGTLQTVFVWNDTVANLTLMAVGSSCPEILLSVIELLSREFFSGDLGPSTIVGSAAFNMFCISAVCVSALPHNHVRKIEDTGVFFVTATFSVFAYLWLLFVVSVSSPNEVTILEGVITLLLLPVLVGLAFAADKGYLVRFFRKLLPSQRPRQVGVTDLSKEELAALHMEVKQVHTGLEISDEQMARLLCSRAENMTKTRATYRVEATRNMFSGARVRESAMYAASISSSKSWSSRDNMRAVVPVGEEETYRRVGSTKSASARSMRSSTCDSTLEAKVEFLAGHYAVLESVDKLDVAVVRRGCPQSTLQVHYKSRDGTAVAGEDYVPVEGILEFGPGETHKLIRVTIVDDKAYEVDEDFFLELSTPRLVIHRDRVTMSGSPMSGNQLLEIGSSELEEVTEAGLGVNSTCKVSIIDDDAVGELYFETDTVSVTEGTEDVRLTVKVFRKKGSCGDVSCRYYTEHDSAVQGLDYVHVEGELELKNSQVSADIELTILPRGRYERQEKFRLYLTDPKGGVKFDPKTDGGERQNILTITIRPDEVEKEMLEKVFSHLVDMDTMRIGYSNYKEQLFNALMVNGGDDMAETQWIDWIVHIICVPWKLLFALVPPSDYCGGWLCFLVALGMIALVTAFINDIASLLGCVLDMPDSITAITFVALGTSLPDTFASRTAAVQDPTADASIGNVTGSNSVNVFLGLGLTWTIGAIYWRDEGRSPAWSERYQDFTQGRGKFVVVGGDLGFSVTVFCMCAVCCLAILHGRRRAYGGELGGPKNVQFMTSAMLVALWLVYVGLSVWKIMENYPC